MFNRHGNENYITLLLILILLINGFLLPYFYFKVFIRLIESSRRALSYNYFRKNQINTTFKITKGLFFSFLFFSMAYFSYFGLILIKDYQSTVPRVIYLYLFLFARSNSVFNPVLYGMTNPMFQRGFRKMLGSFNKVRIQKSEEIFI